MQRSHVVHRFTAGDVIDQRGDLLARLNTSDMFRRIVVGTLARYSSDIADAMPRVLRAHLRHAEAYRVSADMSTLIMHSAALLDETDQVRIADLPTAFGFVRFDSPLVVRDIHNARMLVHALTWGPVVSESDGVVDVLVSLWNDIAVEPDDYTQVALDTHGEQLRRICGRWAFIGVEGITDEMSAGPAERTYDTEDPNAPQVTATNVVRYVLALIMLLNQTIVVTERERPNPHARRRAKANKQSQRDVTVISLRRAYRDDDASTHVATDDDDASDRSRAWHHRWIVRGHWRRQPVGVGRREVRRVWVTPHVKGPEDKPLRVTQKVYDLKR